MKSKEVVLLFDGVCNLCNGVVNFVIDHDPEKKFRFASLQSETGRRFLKKHNLPVDEFNSFILVEGEKYYCRSTAALRVAKGLKGLWPALYAFMIIPTPLRDAVYNLISRNRYKWFGKEDACRVPTPELRARFLE